MSRLERRHASPAESAAGRDATLRLPPDVLRPLQRIDARSCFINIAWEWLAIVGAAAVCQVWWHPLLYVAAVIWIGSRQHALFLLAHEGAHGLLHRDRRWNDRMAELFCAWPVLVPFRSYRRIHLLHHRHLNSERDPDWARNRPDRLRHSSTLRSAAILLGLGRTQSRLLQFFLIGDGERADAGRAGIPGSYARLAFYAVVLTGAGLVRALPLLGLYWLVPLFSWFLMTMRLKGAAEHFAVEDDAPANACRTLLCGPLEATFVAPKNVGYHGAHHAYPNVPFYNLPDLHQRLMELDAFRSTAHVTRGYLAFLRECFRGHAAAERVTTSR